MSIFSKEYFHNETKAFEHLEKILWNGTPICPKCGALDRIYTLEGVKDKKGRVRLGLKKCGHCKSQFTVRVGTVFESAHIPLSKCLQAVYLMCSSKKGISAHQMHRTLEITYKSAWFLCHRIREAMRDALPATVVDRPDKKGYSTPAREWFRGVQATAIGDTLNSRAVADLGLLNPTVVRQQFDDFRSGKPMKELWRLLTVSLSI